MTMQAGWRLVGLEKSGGVRCARIDTAGRGEPRDWRQCGALAGQEEEVVDVIKDFSEECFSESIMEQTVEIARPA